MLALSVENKSASIRKGFMWIYSEYETLKRDGKNFFFGSTLLVVKRVIREWFRFFSVRRSKDPNQK
ncbi:CLUMA_CG018444, isoform A [Clunio marinus]|uniref:CLUMA_CG018444, isoform A n=1 Tax=Clunio marinus TaxID=568069 RepID=A0A1J1IYV5_9DIPT|nr:CLUMA_CG018444, isoform A [Clunio marinus]